MADRAKKFKVIQVYSDASMSQKVIGIGLMVAGLAPRKLVRKEYLKPGLTTVEAELFGIFRGLDLVVDTAAAFGISLKRKKIEFFTDSESAIKAVYSLGKFKSRATKALVKNLVETLDIYKGDILGEWQLQPIRSEDNPADPISREARQEWTARWKLRARGSGQSSSRK